MADEPQRKIGAAKRMASYFSHVNQLPMATAEDLIEKDAPAMERARRCLIYRDMVERVGCIRYRELATWDYQPTDEEVLASLAEYETGSLRKGQVA